MILANPIYTHTVFDRIYAIFLYTLYTEKFEVTQNIIKRGYSTASRGEHTRYELSYPKMKGWGITVNFKTPKWLFQCRKRFDHHTHKYN